MSASTQAKPRGGRVRVRRLHAYIAGGEIQEIRATPAGAIHAMMDHGGSETDYCSPVITIENPPPGLSCAKLKRLVEIAGKLLNGHPAQAQTIGHAVKSALNLWPKNNLGLSSARGGRK